MFFICVLIIYSKPEFGNITFYWFLLYLKKIELFFFIVVYVLQLQLLNMSTTNDMIVARLDTMEKENAALKVRIAELEKQVVSFTKDFKNSNARVEVLEKQLACILKSKDETPDSEVEVKKSKKEPKTKKSKDDTSDDEVEVKKSKKEPKTKKSKDDTSDDEVKKKRGPNGYILFSNENREDVKAKLFVGEEKPKNTEVMKQLAAMWSELGPDEKALWTDKAKALNDVA